MILRQAAPFLTALVLMFGLSACSALTTSPPTATQPPPTATLTPVPPTVTLTPTATPLGCLSQPGRVESGRLETTNPPQEYLIYLPPCYNEQTELRYPVLYLLHGQTFTDDQWVRLGAVREADELILAGESPPFLIVFPDDRFWNLKAGPGFGDRLVQGLIPYIDETYRTQDDRDFRALGGLSRGGGWTVFLGFTEWELFGAMGLHSPAVTKEDAPYLGRWITDIPSESWPRIWIDIGDRDTGLNSARHLESILSIYSVPHEWHQYAGDHTETYWSKHVGEYLRWYTQGWVVETPTATPEAE